MATAFSLKGRFFPLGKNRGLRKSSGCGPHAVRGEKSRRYGHRYSEKTRKSPSIENPFGPSAKSLKSDRQKTLRSIKWNLNDQETASDITPTLGPPTFWRFLERSSSQNQPGQSENRSWKYKKPFAPRLSAILGQDRKPGFHFAGRPFEPPKINLNHKKRLPLEVGGPLKKKQKGPKSV